MNAFRLDVRQATRAAAAGEFKFNGCLVALVSVALADEWHNWSPPVQLRLKRGSDGLAEIEVKQAAPKQDGEDAQG